MFYLSDVLRCSSMVVEAIYDCIMTHMTIQEQIFFSLFMVTSEVTDNMKKYAL